MCVVSPRVKRTLLRLVGVVMVAAGLYLTFAAGVMFLVALTDFSGFVTNAASVGLFLLLLASGLALAFLGLRAIRLRRTSPG